MKGPLVIGIDVGYRNLAICALRAGEAQPCLWRVDDILGHLKADRLTLHHAMLRWCKVHEALLQEAQLIVLETQRKATFSNLNTVIMTLYPLKSRELHPFSLCAAFALPRTRAEKKKATIARVARSYAIPVDQQAKIDDLADAALFAIWGHQTLH